MKLPFETGDVRVTSPYGMRGTEFHKGIDLVGTASTRIVAVEDATVAVSGIVTDTANRTWQWGNYVRLDLADGRRLYHCHLSRRLVKAGEKVKKGQVIGIMGATGNANGAHLHWELRPKGFSTESLDISEYSGIPNRIGTYDAKTDAPLEEETIDTVYRKGDRVRLLADSVYTNGVSVPKKYVEKDYTVMQSTGGRVLLQELYSWVENRYVKKISSAPAEEKKTFPVGAKVKLRSGAVYTNGVSVPKKYIGQTYTVMQRAEGRVLIQELYSWVSDTYVEEA